MDKINEVLKRRVKTLMIDKGLSQADVARSIGELPQTFGNYVRGRTIPADLIRQWKKVYNEDLEELADTTGERPVFHQQQSQERALLLRGAAPVHGHRH